MLNQNIGSTHGLTQHDWRDFNDLLIKMNDIQLFVAVNKINEQVKRRGF